MHQAQLEADLAAKDAAVQLHTRQLKDLRQQLEGMEGQLAAKDAVVRLHFVGALVHSGVFSGVQVIASFDMHAESRILGGL